MDADRLFIATLDDLAEHAMWQSPEYDLLQSSGLLRKLLLDGSPLVQQVAGPGRPKPTYRVRRREPDPSGEPWWWIDAIDPDTSCDDVMAAAPVAIDLRALLTVQMFCLPQTHQASGPRVYLTVCDLIRYNAHVSGGVHRGRAREAQHLALEQFPWQILFGTIPIQVMAIAPITAVVLRGLAPLRGAVEKDLAAQTGT
jgi:hypothetical protein